MRWYDANGNLRIYASGQVAHAPSHINGGSDEIDGDRLHISENPSYYTPASGGASTDVDDLTAHLRGIDGNFNGAYTQIYNTLTSGTIKSLPASTWTSMPFNGEVLDPLGAHDNATNNTRLVIGKKLGWWNISAGCLLLSSASYASYTDLYAAIWLNGAVHRNRWVGTVDGGGVQQPAMSMDAMVEATSPTDYIEFYVYSETGTSIIGIGSTSAYNYLDARWLGP